MGLTARVFIPLGNQHTPQQPCCCRAAADGSCLDLYLCPQQQPGPLHLSAGERLLQVAWLLPTDSASADHSDGVPSWAGGVARSSGPARPRAAGASRAVGDSHADRMDAGNAALGGSRNGGAGGGALAGGGGGGAPLVTLTGLAEVAWRGRRTAVPTAVEVAGEHRPVLLLVLLHDAGAWRQVANAEADDGVAAGMEAAPSHPTHPLPLRLALRPCGNPWIRGLGGANAPAAPHSTAPAAGPDGGPLRQRRQLPQPTAERDSVAQGGQRQPTAAGSAAVGAGGRARAGADGPKPAPWPEPPALQLVAVRAPWPARAAMWAAAALGHTATGRHAAHLAACWSSLRCLMYGDGYGSTWLEHPQPGDHNPAEATRAERLAMAPARHGSRPYVPEADARAGRGRASSLGRAPAGGRGAAGSARGASVSQRHTALNGRWCVPEGALAPADAGGGAVKGALAGGAGRGPLVPVAALRGRAALAARCLLLSLALQLAVGPALGLVVWRQRQALLGAAAAAAVGAERVLLSQYDWLMTATPAGVKLHAELCTLLGLAAQGVLRAAAAVAAAGWPRCAVPLAGMLAGACAVSGAGGGVALLSDLLQLAAAPLTLQAAATGALLRRHLAWLAAAWAMMRGTYGRRRARPAAPPPPAPHQVPTQTMQHPPLPAEALSCSPLAPGADGQLGAAGGALASAAPRLAGGPQGGGDGGGCGGTEAVVCGGAPGGRGGGRVPISRLESLLGLAPDPKAGNEVQVEQLIVGVLLLVPLLALLPSLAAWHLLALAAWGAPAAARAGLAAAGGLLRDNPAVAAAARLLRPLDFPGPGVALRPLAPHPPAPPSPPATLPHDGPGDRGRDCRPSGPCGPRCAYLAEPLPQRWGGLMAASLWHSMLEPLPPPRPWGGGLGAGAGAAAWRRGGEGTAGARPVPGPGAWAWACIARAGRLLTGRELVLPYAGPAAPAP